MAPYYFEGDYNKLIEDLLSTNDIKKNTDYNYSINKVIRKLDGYLKNNIHIDLECLLAFNKLNIERYSYGVLNTELAALFGGFIGIYCNLPERIVKLASGTYSLSDVEVVTVFFVLLVTIYISIKITRKKGTLLYKKYTIIDVAIKRIIEKK